MYSLKSFHTFGFDAYCKYFTQVDSIAALKNAIDQYHSVPKMLLGEGSNCIFVDDYQGAVIAINLKGKQLDIQPQSTRVTVGAGENWHDLVSWCLQNGLYGLENLALIPGTVGAAPIQNIGAYGVEVERFIASVDYLDSETGQIVTLAKQACEFGYRDSIFKRKLAQRAVVTHVTFDFPHNWEPVLTYGELQALSTPTPMHIYEQVIAIRSAKLPNPKQVGNAGSFFKNPTISVSHFQDLQSRYAKLPGFQIDEHSIKVPAAWLIDQAGFKGQRRGGIQCHPQQALVLTNSDNGTGTELLGFAREIVVQVERDYQIQLENEVRLIGSNGLVEL